MEDATDQASELFLAPNVVTLFPDTGLGQYIVEDKLHIVLLAMAKDVADHMLVVLSNRRCSCQPQLVSSPLGSFPVDGDIDIGTYWLL